MQNHFAHRENAFTLLRYVFAFSLIGWHFNVLNGNGCNYWIPADICVYSFFILSGFLTAVSFERPFTLRTYIKRRICRTVIPYMVPVLVCFMAGAWMTTLPVAEYFRHPDTWRYLSCNLAFLNFLQPELPGVFTQNNFTAVNGALWSMKVELLFYCTVPFLQRVFKRFRPLPVVAALFVLSVCYTETCQYFYQSTGDTFYAFLKRQIPGQYVYFSGGMMAYYLYGYAQRKKVLTACIVLFIWIFSPIHYINVIGYSLLLVFLAYKIPQYIPMRRLPNITYGIYLYHFPVIQAFIAYRILQDSPYLCFTTVVIVTFILSWMAHRWVEQPLRRA